MKKRVYLIAAVVSGALAVSGCTTNPYTANAKQVNLLSAQVWALSLARVLVRSLLRRKIAVKARSLAQQQAQLWAAALVITWMCRKRSCVTKCAALVLA